MNTRVDWKSIRDNNIVKQSTDYSCGSSSVATILKYFYLTDTSEREVLSRLPNLDGDLSASLLELSKAVESYGFKAVSLEINFEKLKTLKLPAIAYIKYGGREHFTVVKGINKTNGTVWLADSSLGNTYLSEYKFKDTWLKKGQNTGIVFLILPKDKNTKVNSSFFSSPREERTFQAKEFLLNKVQTLPFYSPL